MRPSLLPFWNISETPKYLQEPEAGGHHGLVPDVSVAARDVQAVQDAFTAPMYVAAFVQASPQILGTDERNIGGARHRRMAQAEQRVIECR